MEFQILLTSFNLDTLIPEFIIIFSILLICIFDLIGINQNWRNSSTKLISIFGLLFSFIVLLFQLDEPEKIAFFGSFRQDSLSIFFRILSVISSFICLFLSLRYINISKSPLPEFFIFLLTATLGCMLLAGANDLVILFISLETLGFASYLLSAYFKQESSNNEGALKYLFTGLVSSSFLLYGLSWLYGLSGGHLDINYIGASFINSDFSTNITCLVSLLLILVGLGFKLSLFPFHQWAPDLYQTAPSPVVAFLSVASKSAGLIITVRLFTTIFPYLFLQWNIILQVLAIGSMFIGTFVAFTQTSFKRLLGYSSIGQAGFLLIGLICGDQNGYSSLLVYNLIYLFMNLGTFAALILFSLRFGTDEIKDYSALSSKDPVLAFCLSSCLLSLAGMPPFSGFFGKLYLFLSGWTSGAYFLIVVALILSVISIYYTLKIVKLFFISSASVNLTSWSNLVLEWQVTKLDSLKVSIIICTLFSILLGLVLDPLIHFSNLTISSTSSLSSLNGVLSDLNF